MRKLLLVAAVLGVALAAAGGAQAVSSRVSTSSCSSRTRARPWWPTRTLAPLGARILAVYGAALKGYAARLTPAQLAAVRADPRVAFVEADRTVSLSTTQTNAPWGLDRIDQRARPPRHHVHVLQHRRRRPARLHHRHRDPLLALPVRRSRVDRLRRRQRRQRRRLPRSRHVAGTVGGSTYGVAKGVSLIGVRVLNCSGSGTNSGVIAGVNWVTGNHQAGQPAVANMSLGGGASSALDTAVRNSIADGVSYAIAAGNGNALGIAQNACNSSPARVTEAMTIQCDGLERPEGVVGQLRQLRRLVRARRLDQVGLVQQQHRHEDDQRHLDGNAAHRGRGCPLPPEQSARRRRASARRSST